MPLLWYLGYIEWKYKKNDRVPLDEATLASASASEEMEQLMRTQDPNSQDPMHAGTIPRETYCNILRKYITETGCVRAALLKDGIVQLSATAPDGPEIIERVIDQATFTEMVKYNAYCRKAGAVPK
jgi:hypothetical protein